MCPARGARQRHAFDNDDDSVPPMEIDGDYIDTRDSDDETYHPANPDYGDYF